MKNLFVLILGSILTVSLVSGQPGSTMDNLQEAYNDEANAVKKYEQYSVKAAEEGYMNVSRLFRAVSKSESVHMQNHREAIEKMGGKPQKVAYEKVKVKSTKENLKGPIMDEQTESESTYPKYLEVAEAENANAAKKTFTYAMSAEKGHEMFLNEALANLGHNLKEDYYVSSVTGEIISAKGTEKRPKAKLEDETFIKIN